MKKANYLFVLIILLFIMGCKKGDKTERLFCGVKEPLTEIEWLAEIIESAKTYNESAKISYCTYNNGMEGFYVDRFVNDDEDMSWWGYYDCEGILLCGFRGFAGIACIDSFEVFSTELIWEYTREPEPEPEP